MTNYGFMKPPIKFVAFNRYPPWAFRQCDLCSHPITNIFWVEDATGRQFSIGMECVKKLADRVLTSSAKEAVAAIKAGGEDVYLQKKKLKEERKAKAEKKQLDQLLLESEVKFLLTMPDVLDRLGSLPSEWAIGRAKGGTLLDDVMITLRTDGWKDARKTIYKAMRGR